ncbi:hypothetical protein [Anaerosporobacter sp.]|uniref:hypothetical protein n=1 Tax=Anaerosporobacter sp. TaxID=1872529 RepID=UPI00286F2797|nr:hypothetical protein [Anaerosporobacter sp.]
MSYAHELWPVGGKSFFDINDSNYLVHIKWSRNLKKDYQKLSEDFFICGYKICEKIVDSGHDNIKSDTWFLPSMYLFRQGMELGIKAFICDVVVSKHKIQQIFLECKHDLYKLFETYDMETATVLTSDEHHWIKEYLLSLEEVDAKSDLFRFPFEDDFLSKYRNKFLNVVDMANSMLQAYGIVQKCLHIPESERIDRFDAARSSELLQFSSHGIGNCYLWESLSGDGFHKQVWGYSLAAEFLFYECSEITKEDKTFPILFLMRNLIELGLKRMFYKTIEHRVPRNVFLSKRRSHLLYKELWKHARPMIEHYSKAQAQSLELINLVEKQIQELSGIDKNGDIFRYPTSYSLEYRFDDINIDLKNTYEFMQAISNFCDGCDSEFEAVADWESDMRSEMAQYEEYY